MVLIEKSVKWIYTRKTEWGILTEHKIRPADTWWKPWPNTRLYLPLNWDSKDPYNNVTYNWAYGSASYSTWSTWIQAANFTGSNAIGLGSSNFFSWQASTVTMSMWFTTTTTETSSHICALNNQAWGYFLQFNLYGNYIYPLPWSANTQMQSTTQMVIGTKYLVTMTVDVPNWIAKTYINWQLEATRNLTRIGSSSWSQYIGCRRDWWWDYWKWMIREFILEDKVWTADEILAYYNQTK